MRTKLREKGRLSSPLTRQPTGRYDRGTVARPRQFKRKPDSYRASRQRSHVAGPRKPTARVATSAGYAALAGRPGNLHWWHVPVASVCLTALALVSGLLIHGPASTVLLIAGAILFLPALLTGALMTIASAIEVSASGNLTDADLRQPDKRAMQEAAPHVMHIARWAARVAQLISLPAAVCGVLLYAAAPDDTTYQASLWLLEPLCILILFRLHRVLPERAQWLLATALAILGVGGYLVFGGLQWWNWGQFCVQPLVLLVGMRSARASLEPGGDDPSSPRAEDRLYGGFMQGPFGPP